MKYIIRTIAAIPMLSIGITTILLWVSAFLLECYWLIVPCIFNLWAFLLCSHYYEDTVRSLAKVIKKVAKEALEE